MARFDVRENSHRETRTAVPLLLEVQADLLSGLATRLVVPLVPASKFGRPATRLNPAFHIGNKKFVMDTAAMAGVHQRLLGDKVASLEAESAAILAAVDFLMSGT